MPLSFKEVAEILKIIDASECDEVVLELDDTRLVVRRGGSASVPLPAVPATDVTPSPAQGETSTAVPPPAADLPAAETATDGTPIRAPMVGTFYRRPSPDEPPFVAVGDRVKKGDTVCLIEVMKLFTTIAAPADGVIAAIPVEDADLVEFNQVLIVLNPDTL